VSRRTGRETLTHTQRAVALQAASLLLDYPDEPLIAQLPLLSSAAQLVPKVARDPLSRMVAHLAESDPQQAQRDYVDTFDLRRRCCLFLTYYAFGDTRKRGMALLRFTHAYKATGHELRADELPDHLSVVCEFAATVDMESGLNLLTEHRAGLELIRMALTDLDSPYVDAIDLVRSVLPDLQPGDLERAMELAHAGPPAEEVGLEPFAPPEYMGGSRR
jgi:nitrate reductase molybdenum cofactor assembly chaperone NarJ/NarW